MPMKTNKYLEIERKNQLSLFPKMTKARAKKQGREPIDFTNQVRRCEICGCNEIATKSLTGPPPQNEVHHYCDKDWRRIINREKS
jgi:hypothetical protein